MFGAKKKLVMCQACRGLIDSGLRTCPLCGRQSVPSAPVATRSQAEQSRFFTLLLIGINVALFGMMAALGASRGSGESVLFNGDTQLQIVFGARSLPYIRAGEWWRLITPIFLHANLIHLGFNCFSLYQIGPMVEETLGSQKFVTVYLLTGFFGNALGVLAAVIGLTNPQGTSVGASGALMGLIGLLAVYGYRIGGAYGHALTRQMLFWGGIWIVIGLVGLMPNIDNACHIGGALSGAGIGFLITFQPPATSRSIAGWNSAAIACVLVIVTSFGIVAATFQRTQNKEEVQRQNFGKGQDAVRLNPGIIEVEQKLRDSFAWKKDSGEDPHKIAGELRTAASAIDAVPHIDEPSDRVRQRFVGLANRRADLLESADKNPSALVASSNSDMLEFEAAGQDYEDWITSVMGKYGLERGHSSHQ
jgi:rhomboid protease GluP